MDRNKRQKWYGEHNHDVLLSENMRSNEVYAFEDETLDHFENETINASMMQHQKMCKDCDSKDCSAEFETLGNAPNRKNQDRIVEVSTLEMDENERLYRKEIRQEFFESIVKGLSKLQSSSQHRCRFGEEVLQRLKEKLLADDEYDDAAVANRMNKEQSYPFLTARSKANMNTKPPTEDRYSQTDLMPNNQPDSNFAQTPAMPASFEERSSAAAFSQPQLAPSTPICLQNAFASSSPRTVTLVQDQNNSLKGAHLTGTSSRYGSTTCFNRPSVLYQRPKVTINNARNPQSAQRCVQSVPNNVRQHCFPQYMKQSEIRMHAGQDKKSIKQTKPFSRSLSRLVKSQCEVSRHNQILIENSLARKEQPQSNPSAKCSRKFLPQRDRQQQRLKDLRREINNGCGSFRGAANEQQSAWSDLQNQSQNNAPQQRYSCSNAPLMRDQNKAKQQSKDLNSEPYRRNMQMMPVSMECKIPEYQQYQDQQARRAAQHQRKQDLQFQTEHIQKAAFNEQEAANHFGRACFLDNSDSAARQCEYNRQLWRKTKDEGREEEQIIETQRRIEQESKQKRFSQSNEQNAQRPLQLTERNLREHEERLKRESLSALEEEYQKLLQQQTNREAQRHARETQQEVFLKVEAQKQHVRNMHEREQRMKHEEQFQKLQELRKREAQRLTEQEAQRRLYLRNHATSAPKQQNVKQELTERIHEQHRRLLAHEAQQKTLHEIERKTARQQEARTFDQYARKQQLQCNAGRISPPSQQNWLRDVQQSKQKHHQQYDSAFDEQNHACVSPRAAAQEEQFRQQLPHCSNRYTSKEKPSRSPHDETASTQCSARLSPPLSQAARANFNECVRTQLIDPMIRTVNHVYFGTIRNEVHLVEELMKLPKQLNAIYQHVQAEDEKHKAQTVSP